MAAGAAGGGGVATLVGGAVVVVGLAARAVEGGATTGSAVVVVSTDTDPGEVVGAGRGGEVGVVEVDVAGPEAVRSESPLSKVIRTPAMNPTNTTSTDATARVGLGIWVRDTINSRNHYERPGTRHRPGRLAWGRVSGDVDVDVQRLGPDADGDPGLRRVSGHAGVRHDGDLHRPTGRHRARGPGP